MQKLFTLQFQIVFVSSTARKKLEQVENGGCDRDASSMGSRSSSSGTTPEFG